MNCLSIGNGGHKKVLEEPSAPPSYQVQPPYNPEYIYENFEYLRSLQTWGAHRTEYARRAYVDCECDDRERRSIYEGVNCPTVSAPSNSTCVPHDARLKRAYK